MNNKKIIIPVLAFLVLIPIALADSVLQNIVPSILTDLIQGLFGAESVGFAYQKFLIWLGLFTMFLALLQMTPFGDGKTKKSWVSIVLAIVISAIIVLPMTRELTNAIFGLYSGLVGLIVLLAPVLFFVWVIYKMPGDSFGTHFIRFLVLMILASVLIFFDFSTGNLLGGPVAQVGAQTAVDQGGLEGMVAGIMQWIGFSGTIFLILGVIELFRGLGKVGMDDSPGFNGQKSGLWSRIGRGALGLGGAAYTKLRDRNQRRSGNREKAYENAMRLYADETRKLNEIIQQAEKFRDYDIRTMYEKGVNTKAVVQRLKDLLLKHSKNIENYAADLRTNDALGDIQSDMLSATDKIINDLNKFIKDYFTKDLENILEVFRREKIRRTWGLNNDLQLNVTAYEEFTRKHYDNLKSLETLNTRAEPQPDDIPDDETSDEDGEDIRTDGGRNFDADLSDVEDAEIIDEEDMKNTEDITASIDELQNQEEPPSNNSDTQTRVNSYEYIIDRLNKEKQIINENVKKSLQGRLLNMSKKEKSLSLELNSIEEIAQKDISFIEALVQKISNSKEKKGFTKFLEKIKKNYDDIQNTSEKIEGDLKSLKEVNISNKKTAENLINIAENSIVLIDKMIQIWNTIINSNNEEDRTSLLDELDELYGSFRVDIKDLETKKDVLTKEDKNLIKFYQEFKKEYKHFMELHSKLDVIKWQLKTQSK